jgi:hypothetical protein
METVLLTKESFLKHMGRCWDLGNPLYYCYICEEVFKTKTARYIYGKRAELPPQKKEDLWEEMWEVALTEQKKNPKLTHILAIQGFSDES